VTNVNNNCRYKVFGFNLAQTVTGVFRYFVCENEPHIILIHCSIIVFFLIIYQNVVNLVKYEELKVANSAFHSEGWQRRAVKVIGAVIAHNCLR
jgi:hypothetical protein